MFKNGSKSEDSTETNFEIWLRRNLIFKGCNVEVDRCAQTFRNTSCKKKCMQVVNCLKFLFVLLNKAAEKIWTPGETFNFSVAWKGPIKSLCI